ncbi:MAG: hypothetical protein KAX15_02675 [Candidatus Omnitrophica bacterium]|nr:hypothetical protein [Candidatus Omnitrophota bacterium]
MKKYKGYVCLMSLVFLCSGCVTSKASVKVRPGNVRYNADGHLVPTDPDKKLSDLRRGIEGKEKGLLKEKSDYCLLEIEIKGNAMATFKLTPEGQPTEGSIDNKNTSKSVGDGLKEIGVGVLAIQTNKKTN